MEDNSREIAQELIYLEAEKERGRREIDNYKKALAAELKSEIGMQVKEEIDAPKKESKIKRFINKLLNTCQ